MRTLCLLHHSRKFEDQTINILTPLSFFCVYLLEVMGKYWGMWLQKCFCLYRQQMADQFHMPSRVYSPRVWYGSDHSLFQTLPFPMCISVVGGSFLSISSICCSFTRNPRNLCTVNSHEKCFEKKNLWGLMIKDHQLNKHLISTFQVASLCFPLGWVILELYRVVIMMSGELLAFVVVGPKMLPTLQLVGQSPTRMVPCVCRHMHTHNTYVLMRDL